jgi:chromosome condensin MukBEF ATPase and DNA-binding subunit MukB
MLDLRILRRGRAAVAACGVAGWVLFSSPVFSEEEPAPPPPNVSLDSLFKLPSESMTPAKEERRVAGATRREWEQRFFTARDDLEGAREALKAAQSELEDMAAKADAWQLTAPGAQVTPENSPLSFKLRQDIRRYREDIERYEAALTELRIEANLAGVPATWQEPESQSEEAQDRLAGKNARPGSANAAVSAK